MGVWDVWIVQVDLVRKQEADRFFLIRHDGLSEDIAGLADMVDICTHVDKYFAY